MRGLMLLIACFSLTGCLVGASQGRTTTSYVNDDGIHPVQRTTVTQTSSGSSLGGGMPLMINGGMMGGSYGYGNGYGSYGSGSTACVLHPDRCAVVQTATVVQPMTVVSGGGYVGGGAGTSYVGSGQSGTYAEDDAKLTAMLAKHEKKIAKLLGAAHASLRQTCQILIANPDVITDAEERKIVVEDCKAALAKQPNQTEEK